MALSTVAGITSAMAAGQCYKTSWTKTFGAATTLGYWYNTFLMSGQPSAGTYGSAMTATQMFGSNSVSPAYVATTGKISCAENVSPLVKHLVNIEAVTATVSGAPSWLLLVDMLVNYSGIDMTSGSVQPFSNPVGTNGYVLPRYVDGVGVMMFLEQTVALGGVLVPISQLAYVNSIGNAGAIPSVYLGGYVAIPASTPVQRISHSGVAQNNFGPFLPLAGGDQGVRSATNIQLSSTTTGTTCLILCRPLATIPLITSAAGNVAATARDYIFNMPSLPRIYDGACLAFLYYAGVAATPVLYGTLDFVWG